MRILLYEFIHAGGWRPLGWEAPPQSLRREGAAMLAAVAGDLAALDNVEAVIASDANTAAIGDVSVGSELVGDFDRVLLIAPETRGALETLCRDVELSGGRLLGPSADFVRLTSNKHRTAEYLAAAGLPVPRGMVLPPRAPLPRDFVYPAVLKPLDGAGSQDTWLVNAADSACGAITLAHNLLPRRLEHYCPGMPASVAVLCGPAGTLPLIPCRQRLSADGRFRYLGGALPIGADHAARATKLAVRAVQALPPARGYLGVDLVLGDDPSGRGDVVIEVNPRLTTSYVGLRAMCHQNLAGAMLDVVEGVATGLSWRRGGVEFDAGGRVTRADEPPAEPATVGHVS